MIISEIYSKFDSKNLIKSIYHQVSTYTRKELDFNQHKFIECTWNWDNSCKTQCHLVIQPKFSTANRRQPSYKMLKLVFVVTMGKNWYPILCLYRFQIYYIYIHNLILIIKHKSFFIQHKLSMLTSLVKLRISKYNCGHLSKINTAFFQVDLRFVWKSISSC